MGKAAKSSAYPHEGASLRDEWPRLGKEFGLDKRRFSLPSGRPARRHPTHCTWHHYTRQYCAVQYSRQSALACSGDHCLVINWPRHAVDGEISWHSINGFRSVSVSCLCLLSPVSYCCLPTPPRAQQQPRTFNDVAAVAIDSQSSVLIGNYHLKFGEGHRRLLRTVACSRALPVSGAVNDPPARLGVWA
jgi:hypothetical protein